MEKIKTIWDLHLLDKLYYVHESENKIEDEPITSIAIQNRDVVINNMCSPQESIELKSKVLAGRKYYINRVDAEKAFLADLESKIETRESTVSKISAGLERLKETYKQVKEKLS